MTDYLIANPTDSLLWGIVISVFILIGMFYVYKGLRSDSTSEKLLMIGFACIFFGLAGMRIYFYYANFQIDGIYIDHDFYGNYDNGGKNFMLLTRIAYFSAILGVTIFLLAAEIILKKTRYLLTIVNIFLLVLFFALPFDTAQVICYVAVILSIMEFSLIMFVFTRKSRTQFQGVSMPMVLGIIVVVFGHLFDTSIVKELEVIPPFVSPLLYIFGATIVILPAIINPKYLSRALTNWLLFSIILAIITFTGFSFILSLELTNLLLQIIFIGMVVMAIALFFSIYRTIKIIISKKKVPMAEKSPDILKSFTKRQRVTEEEVKYYREQKICLVCKDKVARIIYTCPECDALYCIKCSKALGNLENACWSCDSAIDPAKPVNLPERSEPEEEETLVGKKNI
ncbi:MAG: hypothetical protein ACFFCS_18860 [Candidatus Hodarchaeota archaeon]